MIGADGSQLGILDTKAAIALAESQGLDLAEVAPTSQPPVCKILDYGKYKYQLKKKAKQAKKNQVITVLKEVQFRPQTDEHDIDYKVKHIQRFLEEANKVKVSVRFRGREASHAELGHALVKEIIKLVGEIAVVESYPKMEGKVLSLIFSPNPKFKKPSKSILVASLPSTPVEGTAAPAAKPAPATKPAAGKAPSSQSDPAKP